MITRRRTGGAAVAISLLLVSAPAWSTRSRNATEAAPTPGEGPAAGGSTGSDGAPGPADRAMMSGMSTMQRTMSDAPMTGDPDRDFVAMMEPHHQGAIDMARVELRYGRDPTLRRMAGEIVAAQEREIAAMRAWQAAHPE